MTIERRRFLQVALGAAASLLLVPLKALAGRPEAFNEDSMDGVLSKLSPSEPVDSGDITIKAPDIAENGAVVPITVETSIPGAESVSIVVENNPNPLAASFDLTPSSGGMVSTRIKMGKTSPVYAVVKAGDKVYRASKEVKVTIGGCGG